MPPAVNHLTPAQFTLIVRLHLGVGHGDVLLDIVQTHDRLLGFLDLLMQPHRHLLLGVLRVGDGNHSGATFELSFRYLSSPVEIPKCEWMKK